MPDFERQEPVGVPHVDPLLSSVVGEMALRTETRPHEPAEIWRGWLGLAINGTDYIRRLEQTCGIDTAEAVREREWNFFRKVYSHAHAIATGNTDTVVMLFDVDQTICEDVSGNERAIVRPAFPLLISALRGEFGDRLRVGMLTTGNSKHSREACLNDIGKHVLAEEFLIDTRQYAQAHPELMLYDLSTSMIPNEVVLSGLRGLLRPDIYAAIEDNANPLHLDDIRDADGKLEILRNICINYWDRAIKFIFIDNLPSAGVIRDDHSMLSSVYVGPEVQSELCAIQRDLLPNRLAAAGLVYTG